MVTPAAFGGGCRASARAIEQGQCRHSHRRRGPRAGAVPQRWPHPGIPEGKSTSFAARRRLESLMDKATQQAVRDRAGRHREYCYVPESFAEMPVSFRSRHCRCRRTAVAHGGRRFRRRGVTVADEGAGIDRSGRFTASAAERRWSQHRPPFSNSSEGSTVLCSRAATGHHSVCCRAVRFVPAH